MWSVIAEHGGNGSPIQARNLAALDFNRIEFEDALIAAGSLYRRVISFFPAL